MIKKYLFLLLLPFLASCSNYDILKREDVKSILPLPVYQSNLSVFNKDAESPETKIVKSGLEITGYKTFNKEFLEQVIKPQILPHLEKLKSLSKSQIINELTINILYNYNTYIGQDFYRWGGDLLDLDDPQNRSINYKKKYGLDCSGFATSPYEAAVFFGLIKPEEAVFSSKGYEYFCSVNRDNILLSSNLGLENNFRLDTKELVYLGDLICTIEKDTSPTEEQLSLVKAGDLVGRNGHFGIIIQNNGKFYYIESGGWVVPDNNGHPVELKQALTKFASSGTIYIRRGLIE